MSAKQGTLRACFNVRVPGFGPVVRSVAEMRDIPAWRQEIRLSTDWDLLYLYTPTRIRLARGAWCGLAGGSAVLLPPFTRFRVDTRPSRGRGHHAWMAIDGMERIPVSGLPPREGGPYHFHDPDGILGQAFANMVEVVTRLDRDSFWAMQHLGCGILALLSRAERGVADDEWTITKKDSRLSDPLVARVLAYLSCHMSERVTLVGIARALGASRSTLSHRYRELAGETALATHRRMRMLGVKRLLAQGQSLAAIAATVGYGDMHHLSREFKRLEGMSPRAFVARFVAGAPRSSIVI